MKESREDLIGIVEMLEELDNGDLYLRVDAFPSRVWDRMHPSIDPFRVAKGELQPLIVDLVAARSEIEAVFGAVPSQESWVQFSIGGGGLPAFQHSGPLGEIPESTPTTISEASFLRSDDSDGISRAFTLASQPDAVSELSEWRTLCFRSAPRRLGSARLVIAFNVGQGNCNLVTGRGMSIYFDLGGGCYWHRHTYPKPRNFPFADHSMVVLSHWDCDHWYGGWIQPAAHRLTWLVPRQVLGPTAATLAAAIAREGRLIVWPDDLQSLYCGVGRIHRCIGSSRNDSGLAMEVTLLGRRKRRKKAAHVLLPGDARYDAIPISRAAWAGLVASHHGSDKVGITPTGAPDCRIVYSHGHRNRYGHPSNARQTADRDRGWRVQGSTADCDLLMCPRDYRLCNDFLIQAIIHSVGGVTSSSCEDGWCRSFATRWARLCETAEPGRCVALDNV